MSRCSDEAQARYQNGYSGNDDDCDSKTSLADLKVHILCLLWQEANLYEPKDEDEDADEEDEDRHDLDGHGTAVGDLVPAERHD